MKYYAIIFLVTASLMFSLSAYPQVAITNDGSSPDSSAMLDVKSTDKGMLIPRMTRVQRAAISTPATGLMVFDTDTESFWYHTGGTGWIRIGEHTGLYIGKAHQGGIIFYLNETGQHGLICSMVDISQGQAWSNVTDALIGESAQSHWNGHGNSLAIVNQPLHVSSAAKLCLDYTNASYGTGIFSDWYLPSIGEFVHLGNNMYEVQKTLDSDGNASTTAITDGTYWTSSENDNNTAWAFSIVSDGAKMLLTSKSDTYYVRAIRAF